MDEEVEYTLISPDGQSTETLTIGGTRGEGSGELQQLLNEGYTFDPQHNDQEIRVYGFMPDSTTRGSGSVRIGDLSQAQRWHQELHGENLSLITGNRDLRYASDNENAALDRRDRIRQYADNNRLEAFTYGALAALPGGAAIAPVGRLIDEEWGQRVAEVTEANPLIPLAGGLTGFGVSALGARAASAAALANNATPGVSRAFSRVAASRLGQNRLGRLATQNLAEEIYFNAAMSSLQENPQLSAESILAGGAFGMAIGLPFMRGTGDTAMRGVRPATAAQAVTSDARAIQDAATQAGGTPTGTASRAQQALEEPGLGERIFLRMSEILSDSDPNALRMFYSDPTNIENLRQAQNPNAIGDLADDYTRNLNNTLDAAQEARASRRSTTQMGPIYENAIVTELDNIDDAARATRTDAFNTGSATLTESADALTATLDDVNALRQGRDVDVAGRENLLTALVSVPRKELETIGNFARVTRNALRGVSDGSVPLGARQSSLIRSIDQVYRDMNEFLNDGNISTQAKNLLKEEGGFFLTLREMLGNENARRINSDAPGMFGQNVSEIWARRNDAMNRMVDAEKRILGLVGDNTGQVSSQRFRSKLRISTKGEEAVELTTGDLMTAVDDMNSAIDDFAKMFGDAGETAELINRAQGPLKAGLERYNSMMRTVDGHNRFLRHERNAVDAWGGSLGAFGTAAAGLVGLAFGGLGVAGSVGLGIGAVRMASRPARTYATKLRIARAMEQFTGRTKSGAAAVKRKLKSPISSDKVRRVSSTARSVAAVGFGRLTYDAPAEKRAEEFFRLQTELRQLAANHELLADNLGVATTTMAEVSPDTAAAFQSATVHALQYLVANTPAVMTDPLFPDRMAAPPSQSEMDDFLLRYRALHDPTVILHDFANNTLSQASVDTVRNVYPEAFAGFQGIVGEILSDIDAGKLPYQTRLALSTFMGSQTDVTLASDFVLSMQDRSAQTSEQASAQGMERMPARNINISTSYLTEGQSLENMR